MHKSLKSVLELLIAGAAFAALAGCTANGGDGEEEAPPSAQANAPTVILALNPSSIQQGQTSVATWSSQSATSCMATGAWSGALPANNSVGVTLGPIAGAGTYTYGIICTGSGGSEVATQVLTVGAVPAPVIQLSLSPASIRTGDSATLTWSTTNAASCTGNGGTGSDGWASAKPINSATGFNTTTIQTAGSYTYNLSCTGPGGSSEETRILTVNNASPPAPPTLTLDASASTVTPTQTFNLSWSSSNATSCSAIGGTGSDGWNGSKPLSSTGASIGPIATQGSYTYTLDCTGSGGNITKSVAVVVSTTNTAPAAVVVINATPAQVRTPGASTISWTTTNADDCTASGSWSGSKPTSGSTSTGTLLLPGTYSYTLSCTGVGGGAAGSATAQVVVRPPAASISVFVSTQTAVQVGASVQLSWNSNDADTCTAGGGDGFNGIVSTSSTGTTVGPITTSGLHTYTLVCTGPGGTSSIATVLIAATPTPPIPAVINFTATPAVLQVGESTSLAWNTNGATSCTATGGTGSDGWAGAKATSHAGLAIGPIASAGIYAYTLTCTGPGGTSLPTSALVTATAQAPIPAVTSFSAAQGALQVGQSTSLSWTSTGASSCAGSGGTGSDGWAGALSSANGTATVGPFATAGIYLYSVTCSGAGGTSLPALETITVTSLPPLPLITAFAALPSSIPTGQSLTLTWASVGATSCAASGGAAGDGWTGAVPTLGVAVVVGPINTAGNYTYTLTCSGPGGASAPLSVPVTVYTAAVVPTISSFVATPLIVQTGQSSTLTWSANNATACSASGGGGVAGWSGAQATSSTGTTVGPFNSTGVYTFSLTCTGAGGTSLPGIAVVTATPLPPLPTVDSFTASHYFVQTGQSTTLSWESSGANSCAATGGSGADGWTGALASLDGSLSVGPIPVGIHIYSITCTGPGGTSLPGLVTITATNAPPPASITAFAAIPSSVPVGGSITLSWVSLGSTSCTATGGAPGDGWAGAKTSLSVATVIGPLNAAGNYTYTLTCTGAGGTSAPSSLPVTVYSPPPLPTITSFTASSTDIQVGQTTTLSWSSNNALTCLATGGSGLDGWLGVLPVSASGALVGPVLLPGTYTYTLTCTGPGGVSAPASVAVNVTSPPPAATISSFAADNASLRVGDTGSLAWTSVNASSCAASGGTGSDGWSGSVPTSATARAVGPFTNPGIYIYSLTCTGAGGSSLPALATIIVTTPVPAQPTVNLLANNASATQIEPGSSVTLKWSSTNATACVATGGATLDGWAGVRTLQSNGTSIGPIATPGIYSYSLTCTGLGGSNTSTAVVTVSAATATDCAVGHATNKLLSPSASVSTSVTGGLCLAGCNVQNAARAVDADQLNFATVNVALGVGSTVSLKVTDATTSYPAGRKVGFLVAPNNTLLSVGLLQNVSVVTLLNGNVQDTATLGNLLNIQALGLFPDPNQGYLQFTTTKPFDSVRFDAGAFVSALSSFKVYGACVSLQ